MVEVAGRRHKAEQTAARVGEGRSFASGGKAAAGPEDGPGFFLAELPAGFLSRFSFVRHAG
jgi:hypothetical protein